jgi:hypothetical protein
MNRIMAPPSDNPGERLHSDYDSGRPHAGEVVKWKARHWGAVFGLLGLILVLMSLSLTSNYPQNNFVEYLKDLGFALGAAGVVVAVIDPLLRNEYHRYMEQSIYNAVWDSTGQAHRAFKAGIEETLHAHFASAASDVRTTIESVLQESLIGEVRSVREAANRRAVADVLKIALGTQSGGDLRLVKSMCTIVNNLYEIPAHENWAKGVFQTYLAEVVQNVAENAESLRNLCAEGKESVDSHSIRLYSPARRTDTILTRLMALLGEGGRYTVLLDVESWTEGKLEGFFSESERAAERGVLIRRIFMMPEKVGHAVSPESADQVLRAHLTVSSRYQDQKTGYRIRLLDHSKAAPWFIGNPMERKHFGIFTYSRDALSIKVRVDERDLSKLYFENVLPDSDVFRNFDRQWDALGKDLDWETLNSMGTTAVKPNTGRSATDS